MDWLREFEPQCAEVVEAQASQLEDFLALQHFAHGCARVFSPDRWALVGEAGVFTDPFYSPGSDFIAMGNDYVTDLIVRDARGEDIGGAGGGVQHHLPAPVRRVHPALRRPVPDHGQRAGDDGEGVVGQRLLLGHHGAAVLPAAAAPAGVHGVDRAADAALLRPARPHAAVLRRPGIAPTPAAVTRPRRRTSSTSSSCGGCRPAWRPIVDDELPAGRGSRTTTRCSKRSRARGRRSQPSGTRTCRGSSSEPAAAEQPLDVGPLCA